MKYFILFLVSFCISRISAQTNFNKSWICGSYGLKLTFENANVIANPYIATGKFFGGGNSNICDSNGKLILISDGMNIYDSALNFIEGGDSLLSNAYYDYEDGWSTYSQSSIFLPFDNSIYYLITPDVTDSMFNWWYTPPFPHSAPFDKLLYHKIDMKQNGGAGKVIEQSIPILEHTLLSKSQMMACKHANGKDWWLVKQWSEENKIVKFLFQKDTILGPYYQSFPGFFHAADQSGQSMFSQDGTKYATTCRATNKIFLADFDRCTGEFSNPSWINVPNYSRHDPSDTTLLDPITQGLAFSPNGNFLYVMKYWNIAQYDLNDSDSSTAWYHVAGLDTTWNEFPLYENSYLGKDNKLYIGYYGITAKEMSVINNPDLKGVNCNFCPKCLAFPNGLGWTSTPPCMPNYDLGAITPCWPLQTDDKFIEEVKVYPNPTNNYLFVDYTEKHKRRSVKIFNAVGQLILTTTETKIDLGNYSKGLYYLRIGDIVKKIIIE